jgi:hypothetical protein
MTHALLKGSLAAVLLASAHGPALAQSQPSGHMPMGGQAQQHQPAQHQPMMSGGTMGQGMMCPMMGPMGMPMGGSGMPMMEMAGSSDPKIMGRMMQMRGDMLKAMADVLLKYGKAIEKGK